MAGKRCINWNDMPGGFKRGRCFVRRRVTVRETQYLDKRTGELAAAEVERLRVGAAASRQSSRRTARLAAKRRYRARRHFDDDA